MRSVLISIRPQWVDKIVSGEKTVEVRKSKPKIAPPFKCYIYCTKEKTISEKLWVLSLSRRYFFPESIPAKMFGAKDVCGAWLGNEKVIGEFVCDRIDRIVRVGFSGVVEEPKYQVCNLDMYCKPIDRICDAACLNESDLERYLQGGVGYGWHISDLKIYDRPKEICDFRRQCKGDIENRGQCGNIGLTWIRPPQSWGYAEERKKP